MFVACFKACQNMQKTKGSQGGWDSTLSNIALGLYNFKPLDHYEQFSCIALFCSDSKGNGYA